MKKTALIRAVTFSLAALVLLCGFWLDASLSLQNTQDHLEAVYLRALGDLADSVSAMESTLHKAMYTGTASTQTAVSAELIQQSGGAKAALAALPFSQERSERVSRFLSQVGDYALSLSRSSAAGRPMEERDIKNLSTLGEYAGRLSNALGQLQARLSAEQSGIVRTVSLLNNVGELEELALLDDDFEQLAEEFAQFPALLYDGPFSDHITRREPLLLKNQEPVTQAQAAALAAEFLGCPAEELRFSGEGGSSLPIYAFTWEDSMVNITRQGGRVSYFRKSGAVKSPRMSSRDALRAAKDYLSTLDLPPLEESYYVQNDGLCAINFHTTQALDTEQVLCYPDLVKVVVELGEGRAVELDCTGLIMNHQQRSLAVPAVSQEEAEQALSPALRPEDAGLALIPTPGLDEVLCWEFHCTAADGTEVLSYVNATTGQEEQLYLLQRDEHGILAH